VKGAYAIDSVAPAKDYPKGKQSKGNRSTFMSANDKPISASSPRMGKGRGATKGKRGGYAAAGDISNVGGIAVK
jgi:hypothetical protein